MRLALVNPSVHPDFLDLPWHLPLAEWESPRGVDLPQDSTAIRCASSTTTARSTS